MTASIATVRPRAWLTMLTLAVALSAARTAAAAPYEGSADDYAQISQLMTRYSYTFDNRDPAGWAGVFTQNGIFRAAGLCLVGRTELADFLTKLVARTAAQNTESRAKSRHINEPRDIEYVDRDHAVAHSFVMVVADVGRDHVGGGIQVTGTYEDKLTRTQGRWLIADRLEVSPGDAPPPPCPAAK